MKRYKSASGSIGMCRIAIATAVTLYAGMACAQSNPYAAQTAPLWKSESSPPQFVLAQDPTQDCPQSSTHGCRKEDGNGLPALLSGLQDSDTGGTVGPQSAFGAGTPSSGTNGTASGSQGSGSSGTGNAGAGAAGGGGKGSGGAGSGSGGSGSGSSGSGGSGTGGSGT